jgi:hypothetical protein
MERRITTIILLVLLGITTVCAQQPKQVSGTVYSAAGHVLVGASVAGGGHTVVTNGDGYFVLKTDAELTSITVSHVGYRAQRVKLSPAQNEPLRVYLKTATIQLQEVLVMSANARELVAAAISKIPKNYSQQPELFHCFYRETAQKRNHYIMVAEGVVDMYKTAYDYQRNDDRVAIRKGRRLLSPRKGDTLSVKVTGGPVLPIQLDMVKQRDWLLNEEELGYYHLEMEMPTTIGDRQQYVVSIRPRRKMPHPLYFGRLYIDQETLAFTRAELSLDMSDRLKATQMMLVKKPLGVRFRPKELSLLIDYRLEDGVTRISYIRTLFRFNCDWRRRLFATAFTACCEMVVTGQDATTERPIRGRESFDQRDAFFDKVDYFLDPVFWQDYNIIEPTESLNRAIARLMKRR